MPRIPPAIIRRALAIDPLLPELLSVCGDLRSAQNELRWLREHAAVSSKVPQAFVTRNTLNKLVARRGRGEPLQYILGSEYFGDLEIKCRPGVLIPRQETAIAVEYLVDRLAPFNELHVLDLCTGTGCIPLLFHHTFDSGRNPGAALDIVGVDVSGRAVGLAKENLENQQALRQLSGSLVERNVSFEQADIFDEQQLSKSLNLPRQFDVLISNPPYISKEGFRTTTARSVRRFEPKLALVPNDTHAIHGIADGDSFYPRLLDIGQNVGASVLLFEVADMDQARRVASLISGRGIWEKIEIWRDDPRARDTHSEEVEGQTVLIRGAGNGRSVLAYRSDSSGSTLIEP